VLDRSEYPNLFDRDCTAILDDEPGSDTGEPVQPPLGLAHQPTDPARAWPVADRVAPRGRVRRLLRYTPATLLVVVLLTHPLGCGQSKVARAGKRGATSASSTTPRAAWKQAERPQVTQRPVVSPAHRPFAVKRRGSSPLSGYTLRRQQTMPATPTLSVAVHVAQTAVPAAPSARVLPTATAPAPSYTTPQPVPAAAHESGREFGFER
jgi:hypothetical protein